MIINLKFLLDAFDRHLAFHNQPVTSDGVLAFTVSSNIVRIQSAVNHGKHRHDLPVEWLYTYYYKRLCDKHGVDAVDEKTFRKEAAKMLAQRKLTM